MVATGPAAWRPRVDIAQKRGHGCNINALREMMTMETLLEEMAEKKLIHRCPHCDHALAPGFLLSAATQIMRSKRTDSNGAPKVLRPCEYCGDEFSARDMRYHIPRCDKNPNKRG